jgi:fucose permease
VGYIVQAIVNNFLPLLFITLQGQYNIPLSRITLLITVNFGVQLTVDMLSAFFVDKIGYRPSIVAAHVFSAAGLLLLPILPELIDPYAGIMTAVCLYAVGGGLIEVLISPIMEACPTDNKEKAMSLLHSFYCWGQVGVVLISTLFFTIAGLDNWRIMSLILSLIPLINAVVFIFVPINTPPEENRQTLSISSLFRNRTFLVFAIMMICAGASELTVSQWASSFAETTLGISKTAGDMAGPMMFAVYMGSARTFYGLKGESIPLDKVMKASTVLCIISYLITGLSPFPVLNLIGCMLCGLSVGIMWPGTFSKASKELKGGSTAMFSILALAGDIGCCSGPTAAGLIMSGSGSMKTGILCCMLFPMVMLICLMRHSKINTQNT